MQKTKLQRYFPMLKTRQEVLETIDKRENLRKMFNSWEKKYQEEFLDFCTGARGVKMLYDSFVKELLNPNLYPERLNEIISILLGIEVTIIDVLPNESARIAAENSLLTMDVVVKLADGSIANVEIQKVGYAFPGQRCACYSADLLLRQYKTVREAKPRKKFSYRDIKNVYTIVFLESSGKEFLADQDTYLHYFEQRSNSNVKLELLQKYIFIPIDIYLKKRENRDIDSRLDAWLIFLGSDDPEDITALIEKYPDFKAMYTQVYDICQNVENAMGLFSKELEILDQNTVKYMMDELQEEIDCKVTELEQKEEELREKSAELKEKSAELKEKSAELNRQKAVIAEQEAKLQAALLRIAQLEAEKVQ